jgi:hypothetical protein
VLRVDIRREGRRYKILRNRTYFGEAVHKRQSYQGEHEPIINQPGWSRCSRRCSRLAPPGLAAAERVFRLAKTLFG